MTTKAKLAGQAAEEIWRTVSDNPSRKTTKYAFEKLTKTIGQLYGPMKKEPDLSADPTLRHLLLANVSAISLWSWLRIITPGSSESANFWEHINYLIDHQDDEEWSPQLKLDV